MAKIKKTPIWVKEDEYDSANVILQRAGIPTWNQAGAFYVHPLTVLLTSFAWVAAIIAIALLN